MDRVADVEYTIVDSVSEALLLEATLIKRHQPRFNVRLKDDKSYPYIKVTLADDFPRIERTRKLPNDGSRYFGPYASASSVDEAMNLIRRLFPFRTCTIDIKEGQRALPRPCLLYHIKRCQGPCIEAIDKQAYRADIEQVMLFLEGQAGARGASACARTWRRRPRRSTTSGRPTCATSCAPSSGPWKARRWRPSPRPSWTCSATPARVVARRSSCSPSAMARRWRATSSFWRTSGDSTDDEALAAFVKQYYAAASSIPPRILVPQLPTDAADLTAFLEARRGRRVRDIDPAARRAAAP